MEENKLKYKVSIAVTVFWDVLCSLPPPCENGDEMQGSSGQVGDDLPDYTASHKKIL